MVTGLREICKFIRKEGCDIALIGGHGDENRVFRAHRATMAEYVRFGRCAQTNSFLILAIGFTVGFRKHM